MLRYVLSFVFYFSILFGNETTSDTIKLNPQNLTATFTYEDNDLKVEKNYQYDAQGQCFQTINHDPSQSNLALPAETQAFLNVSCRTLNDDTIQMFFQFDNLVTGESTSVDELFSAHQFDFCHLEHYIEDIARSIMDHPFVRLSGYKSLQEHVGVYGNGEANDKVRITFANGILNFPEYRMTNLEMFSKLHGGINIHYIFRSYEGWSRDMLRCLAAKFRFISTQARLLAQTWKELIAEMGGVGEGGKIIHYAHSIGGTETNNAKHLMSPEELKMIRVYTLGSATLIANKDFEHVVNFVSKRDGVCYLDPIDYFGGLLFQKDNVVYLDSFLGVPLIDHLLGGNSYYSALEQLGQEFIHTYMFNKN